MWKRVSSAIAILIILTISLLGVFWRNLTLAKDAAANLTRQISNVDLWINNDALCRNDMKMVKEMLQPLEVGSLVVTYAKDFH